MTCRPIRRRGRAPRAGVHFLVTLLAALVSTACAAPPAQPVPPVEPEPPVETLPESTEAPVAERPATDSDVIYQVLAGEWHGAEGELAAAADAYLEAALESNDPAIAERAARVAVAAQSWQQAAMASVRWAQLDPDSIEARETAVVAQLRVDDYASAEVYASELLRLMPDDRPRAWAIIAGLLSRAQYPDKAEESLERLLQEFDAGQQVDAMLARSRLAARAGDLPRARALATRALAADPSRADLHTWAGRLALTAGDMAGARRHLGEAWRLDPDDLPVAQAYAELLARAGEPAEAEAVLASLPTSPELRFARIGYALQAGNGDDALALYQAFDPAQAEDPDEEAFQAARAAELLERPEEAIEWYERVHQGPRLLDAVVRQAWLHAGQGDVEAARNILATLRVQTDPAVVAESYLAESQILREQGHPEAAFDALSIGLEQRPGDVGLLYARAIQAVELDRIDIAEGDLRRILAEQPDNATALNALGYTLADRTDRYDEAEALILEAYALDPDEPSIIDSMGWIAYRLGRLNEAVQYLRMAWALDRNPEIAAHLGEVLWVSGERDEAQRVWRDGQEVDADNAVLNATLDRFGVTL
ncbi:MAG: tetratricopeptide repeat protein [Xanthomonadales bacterium]|nr:tetratricopeptide repeat protein [Xanthomonadales bacterium]